MAYSSTLASYAAEVALSCHFAHNTTPGAITGGYGQNIAEYSSSGNVVGLGASHMVAWAITDEWYDHEEPLFLPSYYGEPNPTTNFDSWGHFTQVVWKASNEVGCAAQLCPAGTISSNLLSWFVVCNYRAQGNIANQYAANVAPPLGQPNLFV